MGNVLKIQGKCKLFGPENTLRSHKKPKRKKKYETISQAWHKISNNCKNLKQTNCKMVYPGSSSSGSSSISSWDLPSAKGPKCALKITKFSYATFEPVGARKLAHVVGQ